MRTCGDCTACCEGYLTGEAHGKTFYKGKPCHFVSIGKGCTIYKKRPEDPCKTYQCAWLLNDEFPEWFKPNFSKAIIDYRKDNDIEWIRVHEAGQKLDSAILSWLIVYCLSTNRNLFWEVDSNKNWVGAPDFCNLMQEKFGDKSNNKI